MTDEITDADLEQQIAALQEATDAAERAQRLQALVALLRQGGLTPAQRTRLVAALQLVDDGCLVPADTRYF